MSYVCPLCFCAPCRCDNQGLRIDGPIKPIDLSPAVDILHDVPGWMIRRTLDPYNIEVLKVDGEKKAPYSKPTTEEEITVLKNALAQKHSELQKIRKVLTARFGDVLEVMR